MNVFHRDCAAEGLHIVWEPDQVQNVSPYVKKELAKCFPHTYRYDTTTDTLYVGIVKPVN
jgi:hypothetical protein